MYSSKGYGVIGPDGLIVTPSECARLLNELSNIISSETPIAALDLSTTWRAERDHLQEELQMEKRHLDRARERILNLEDERNELRQLITDLNDRAPEVADAVLGGIAMDPAIRAYIKSRIITLLQATKTVSL